MRIKCLYIKQKLCNTTILTKLVTTSGILTEHNFVCFLNCFLLVHELGLLLLAALTAVFPARVLIAVCVRVVLARVFIAVCVRVVLASGSCGRWASPFSPERRTAALGAPVIDDFFESVGAVATIGVVGAGRRTVHLNVGAAAMPEGARGVGPGTRAF